MVRMVVISDYLVLRFQMRADSPNTTKDKVKQIWREAEITNTHGEIEERYSEEYNIVLIKRGNIVKTVLTRGLMGNIVRNDECRWCKKNRYMANCCKKCDDRLIKEEDFEIQGRNKL